MPPAGVHRMDAQLLGLQAESLADAAWGSAATDQRATKDSSRPREERKRLTGQAQRRRALGSGSEAERLRCRPGSCR